MAGKRGRPAAGPEGTPTARLARDIDDHVRDADDASTAMIGTSAVLTRLNQLAIQKLDPDLLAEIEAIEDERARVVVRAMEVLTASVDLHKLPPETKAWLADFDADDREKRTMIFRGFPEEAKKACDGAARALFDELDDIIRTKSDTKTGRGNKAVEDPRQTWQGKEQQFLTGRLDLPGSRRGLTYQRKKPP